MLFLAEGNDKAWIVALICQAPDLASGACHRSLQLQELLERGGYRLTPIEAAPRPAPATIAWAGLVAGVRDGFYQPLGLASLRNAGAQASHCRGLFARHPQACGLILEGTGYGALTATAWCRRHGKRTILVPANVESLASYPPVWPYGRLPTARRWRHELPWWRQADAVVTIAIEEAWLLELHGVPCHHLPYFPPAAHQRRLATLAEDRRRFREAPDAEAIGYLLVADFGNAPNREGFSRLLNWLRRQPPDTRPVHVAGRGSAALSGQVDAELEPRLVLHGEVTDATLHDLQRRCQALLILNPASSGMLTRIIDAALADLPVVGDWMSFKSYHHCFDNGLLIASGAPAAPSVRLPPAPPRQAEERFLDLLSR